MKLQNRDVAFFVLGGIVFLLGSLFTPFQAPRVDAQPPIQDWIRCGHLQIIDETGHPVITLAPQTGGGGILNIFGKGGMASVSSDKHGGTFWVSGGDGDAALTVDETGARFSVKGDGKSEARLSTDEHGGSVSIVNKTGQEVGQWRASAESNGILRTLDRHGNETGSLP